MIGGRVGLGDSVKVGERIGLSCGAGLNAEVGDVTKSDVVWIAVTTAAVVEASWSEGDDVPEPQAHRIPVRNRAQTMWWLDLSIGNLPIRFSNGPFLFVIILPIMNDERHKKFPLSNKGYISEVNRMENR
jgi:hypothetical protein